MSDAEPGWFDEIADFLGPAYWAPGTSRVASFTTGTEQEVDFIVGHLAPPPSSRVLDVGCGPGRHSLELARRGFDVVGVDLSTTFIDMARRSAAAEALPARFEVMDVRDLSFASEFDLVICLCQGGFGLLGGSEDAGLLARFAAAAKRGGGVVVSAFSAFFAVTALESGERFDAATGVLYERNELESASGDKREFEMWTTCFTPRELRALAGAGGLIDIEVYSVTPGRYATRPPDIDHPEYLLVARKP